MSIEHVVVVGGSITGLGAAVALSRRGTRVTVLEADAAPLPASPVEAFERWERKGAPQTRHSHAFLARVRNLIRDEVPELYAGLLENGAGELRFTDMLAKHFPDEPIEASDEDLTLLACRRVTFEWVLRRFVLDGGRVAFRDGTEVVALEATDDAVPRVRGVRVRDRKGRESAIEADFVVDASGRRSRLPHWLAAMGARELREDSEPCGIFYSSRFYRLHEGAEAPVMEGAIGADLGYMKYGVFPGDGGIFSVTLAASPDDDVLRSVLQVEAFDRAANAFPAVAEWIDPSVSEPISAVHGMGGLRNTRRFFVDEGEPAALGVYPIGDALIHTNPLNGRGCTLGFVSAFELARAMDAHPDDLRALALDLDAAFEREIVPWYESTRMQDRDAIAVARIQGEGRDPFATQREDGTVDPAAYMRSLIREGLVPGLREDVGLMRRFMRLFNLLEPAADLMKDPSVLQSILASYQRRDAREPVVLGPGRHEMIERLRDAA